MKNSKIYFMLVGFSLFTGATFHLAKYTLAYMPSSFIAACRFGLAACIMLLILAYSQGIKGTQIRENIVQYIVLGIVGVLGFNALFFIGLQFTSPLNGSLIMATNPLVATVLARVVSKEEISKRQVVGMIFALLGVILVITQGSLEVMRNLSFSIGDVIILGGNVCWAFYGVYGRRFVKNSTPLATTTYSMVIGAVGLFLLSFVNDTSVAFSTIPIGVWGSIAFMAIFTSVLGYLWWNQGMKEIGVAKTSLFFNVVPIITMIISFFLGTPVTIAQLMGVCLVVSGVLTSSGVLKRGNKKQKEMEVS